MEIFGAVGKRRYWYGVLKSPEGGGDEKQKLILNKPGRVSRIVVLAVNPVRVNTPVGARKLLAH